MDLTLDTKSFFSERGVVQYLGGLDREATCPTLMA